MRFSHFISIAVSACLLVNLFAASFTTVFKSEKGEYLCESHSCGCKSATDCLNHCCCAKESNTLEMKCLLKEDSKDIPSIFIQSLACAGVPDQFTAISYTISLPDDSICVPIHYPFYYGESLQPASPISLKYSPPDKPPRIT